MKGTGAERCTGAREGARRGPGDGVRVKGTGAERDNGARACTGRCRGPGRRALRMGSLWMATDRYTGPAVAHVAAHAEKRFPCAIAATSTITTHVHVPWVFGFPA